MAVATVNGVRLGYDETGAGSPLIWVHGGFTDRRGFDQVVSLLSDRYRVIAYDRRGHSESERRPGAQCVADHVADLAALIRHLDAVPAHVVANSDGGDVALKLAVREPSLVASVAVHEPSLFGVLPDSPEVAAYRSWLDTVATELERGGAEAGARMIVEAVGGGPGAWEVLPEETRRAFTDNALTWLDTARDPEYGTLTEHELAGVTLPVLVTDGERGDPIDRAVAHRLARLLPNVHRHTFAGLGHVPHRTHPDRFAATLLNFLRSAS